MSEPSDQEVEARKRRVEQCMQTIRDALDHFQCVIVSTLDAEPVGTMRDSVLIRSGWGVVPKKDPEPEGG